MLGEYVSSLRRECGDRGEGQELISEALVFIKWVEKKGLGRSEGLENIGNRELATSLNEKTVSKKGLVNIAKSRLFNRRWTVATRFDI